MKLYVIPISPNCRRVEAIVHHLDLDVEIHMADMMAGDLKTEQFMALNPNGKVPLLTDGDLCLWESNAIMQHLAGKRNLDEFYPANPKSRVDISRWQFWECLHFNKAIGTICWETIAKPAMQLGEPDEATIESGIVDFHPFARVLEAQLDGQRYIMGGRLTVADFSVGSHSAFVLNPDSRVPLDDYPNIKSWYQSLEDVPAWAKTAPAL